MQLVERSLQLAAKIPILGVQNRMSLIRAAGNDVGLACWVLETLKTTGNVPDTAAYNSALDVCAVAGDVESARNLLNVR